MSPGGVDYNGGLSDVQGAGACMPMWLMAGCCCCGLHFRTGACQHTHMVILLSAAVPKITNLVIYGGGLDGFLQAFVEGQQDPYYPTTTICADGFTAREARVACRMLGMAGGEVAPAVPAPLPIVTAPKAITGVKCKGNEGDLSACTYAINGFCKNRRAAGVICEREPCRCASS